MKETIGQGLTCYRKSLGSKFSKMSVTISLGEVRGAIMGLIVKSSIWDTELNVDDNIVCPHFVVRIIK